MERLYEGFRAAGFSYRSARGPEPKPQRWDRPPLFTDLLLAGQPLQEFLGVGTRLAVDELADVYERFIAGYLYSRRFHSQHSDEWLRRSCKLGYYEGHSLFTRPAALRLGLHRNLMEFAALVAYNAPADIEHGKGTFTVFAVREGLKFGVSGGRLVTNLRRARRKITVCHPLSRVPRPCDLPRGSRAPLGQATFFDTLREWLERHEARLGTFGAALQLGLQILWWRVMPGTVPGRLRLLAAYEYSADALSAACEEARRYDSFDNPVQALKNLLHPTFMTMREFVEMFGDPHRKLTRPVPASIRQKWDQAINSLDPAYQGGAT